MFWSIVIVQITVFIFVILFILDPVHDHETVFNILLTREVFKSVIIVC